MTRTHLIGAILTLAISAASAAQTLSIPQGLIGPGNQQQASNNLGPRRHQIILDRLLVGPGSRTLQGITLHCDESTASAGNAIDVTVSLGCVGTPMPQDASTTSFVANRGLGLAQVVTMRRMNIPAGPGALIQLPFDNPFLYQSGASLVVQLDFFPANVNPTDNFVATLDAHQLSTNYWATAGRTIGTSCHGAGSWQIGTTAPTDEFVVSYSSNGLRPGNLVALFVGASDQFYGGMVLPQNFSFLGMPGCVMRASMDTVFVRYVAPGATPSVVVSSRLVRDPNLLGVTAHMQVMQFDSLANTAGLTLSEMRSEQLVGAPDQIRALHLIGPITPANPDGVVASADRNRTLVFDLQ